MIIDAHDRLLMLLLYGSGLTQLHKLFRQSGSLGKVALKKSEITHTINLRTVWMSELYQEIAWSYVRLSSSFLRPFWGKAS